MKSIVKRHKDFCDKFWKKITYNCYYTHIRDWYTDKELSKKEFIRWHHIQRTDTVMYQYKQWLEQSSIDRSYEWYLRKINANKPLIWKPMNRYTDRTDTIAYKWRKYVEETGDEITYSNFWKDCKVEVVEPIITKEEQPVKKKLNIDTEWDFYYDNL